MAVLAGLELAIGIGIVLSLRPLVYLPTLSDRLTPLVASFMPEYLGYPIAGALLAIFVALLMGFAFRSACMHGPLPDGGMNALPAVSDCSTH
jgi:hypothetical protein